MTHDFEDRLRDALRPVDPGEDFARRMTLRLSKEPLQSSRIQPARLRWLPAALAASLVLTLFIIHELNARRERSGLEARRQLIEALHMTGEKLHLAYQVINRQSDAATGQKPGA